MKIKLIRYVILWGVVGVSACSEEFLDKSPLDAISSSAYWKTPTDLEMYVNQYYSVFPNETRNDDNLLDGNSDNMLLVSINPILAGTRVAPTSGGSWNSYWTSIRSVNYFFQNYSNVSAPFDLISQFVGEAHFFRAYYYFSLVRDYGDVPWVNKPLEDDSEELFMERAPRHVVMDSIISDLDKAISYMDNKGEGSASRLNRQVAMLFKSRVALFEGTWEENHAGTAFGVEGSDGTKYLNMARDAAKQLIDGDLYSIYSTGMPYEDYAHLFGQNDYSSNSEVMLWKKWDESLGLVRWSPSIWGMGRGITKSLVDSYLCIDGLPISRSSIYMGDENLLEVVQNRDPRLEQSIWVPGDPINILGANDTTFFERADIHQTGSYLCVTGYQLKKHSNAWGENLKQNYYQSEIGSIVFRYAEALLNYAEARAELGEITQSDLDLTINILRDRVGMPHLLLNQIVHDPQWDYPQLSPVINEIRRERRVELAFEGLRLHDFLRWRAHELILNTRLLGAKFVQADFPEMEVGTHVYTDASGYIDAHQKSLPNGYGFKPERDYLNPIPTLELTLNNRYVQNPGW
jgi:hypothetical protein